MSNDNSTLADADGAPAADTSRSSAADHYRPSIGGITYPHLLVVTLALLASTILLGVATKATGAGLACDANWPLCDGGVLNLFPASFPSFFEWIHRVVAMVAGFAVIGAAIGAWRLGVDSRVRYAVTAGLVLLPIQVLLGRETVLSYELTVLSLHYWTAMTIFTLFAVATILTWRERASERHVAAAFAVGAGMVPLHVALSPLFIQRYSPTIQTAQYAVTLALLGALLFAALVGWRRYVERAPRGAIAGSLALTPLLVLFGRRAVMTFAPVLDWLYVATAIGLFALALAGAFVTARR